MVKRTKTYLAGDWSGDKNLIDKLHEWNDNKRLALHFTDVHSLTSSNDTTLNCNIKKSLRQRMDISKTFVLIVGKGTKSLRSGSCATCANYNKGLWDVFPYCTVSQNNHIDNRSYVEYECDIALKDFQDGKLKNIVVIYNGLSKVDRSRCPESLRNIGTHIPSVYMKNGTYYWDYHTIKDAICK